MDKKIKILLAEDNINDVKLLEKEFKKGKLNYEILTVDNENDYIKALNEYNPDIILSDYSMPVFDGLSALKIRIEKSPLTPFIIVTGSINENTAVECLKAGADDYVIKEHINRINPSIKSALRTWDLNIEKEKAQKALVESEARLSNALNIAHLGPWEYDVLNDLFTFNDLFYAIFRTTVEKEGGYTMSSAEYVKRFLHPDDTEVVGVQTKKAIETNDPNYNHRLEHRIIYRDNREVGYITVNIYIIKDENGKTIRTYGVNQDITEQKRVEEELIIAKNKAEEMNRLKSSFLANMSHELRTPMVGILGFSEILSNDLENEELKHFASSIFKSGKRLLNTLNLILDLSRIEANKQDVLLMNTNIGSVTRNIVSEYSILARNKKLYLNFDVKEEDIYSIIDERVFRSIIGNLVDNAIKYTNEGGVIIVVEKVFEDNKDWAVIKIKDTGIGIPDDYLQTIFEEFRQVSEGWSRSFEGTGLGLTIAKRFTDLLNGIIKIDSKINCGSTFTVMLPLVKEMHSSEVEKEVIINSEEKIVSNKTLNFLLIDDDKDVYDLISNLFKNYNFSYADSEEKAIEILKKQKLSLILLDIHLGLGVSGIDILKKIREIPGCKKTPVIAVTAYAMINDKERFINAGCDDYISKPFDKKELYNLINKYI
jgi:signal transduction histidine kinase/DNA-binding response OmpR family regulator